MPVDREAVKRQHRHLGYRVAERHPLVVLADNLDKTSNLGGILRIADAFLVEKVLTNREQPDAAGAMGAEHWQPVEWGRDLAAAIQDYGRLGYHIVALEQMPGAIPLHQFRFPEKVGLVIGAEMFGVSELMLSLCDATIFIPQAGLVKSLNVSAATAIAVYEYSRQHWMADFDQSPRHLAPAPLSVRTKRKPEPPVDGRLQPPS